MNELITRMDNTAQGLFQLALPLRNVKANNKNVIEILGFSFVMNCFTPHDENTAKDIDAIDVITTYYRTQYGQIYNALVSVRGTMLTLDFDGRGEYPICEIFALYYMTKYDITPQAEKRIDSNTIADMQQRAFIFVNIAKKHKSALEAFSIYEQKTPLRRQTKNISPKALVIPNNKLSNTMPLFDGAGEYILNVLKKKNKQIQTSVFLSYNDDNISMSRPFTPFDRAVYNGISSIYEAGNIDFTPAIVWRAMNGLTDNEKPCKSEIDAVTRAIDKMRFIEIRIDCTAELNAYRVEMDKEQIKGGIIKNYLLPAKGITLWTDNGTIIDAYTFMDVPPLLLYADTLKQVIRVSPQVLHIADKDNVPIARTDTRLLLRNALIVRVNHMQHTRAANRVIRLYDYTKSGKEHKGLFSQIDKNDVSREEARRMRADIELILNYWTRIGYIAGYTPCAESKGHVTGYEIRT